MKCLKYLLVLLVITAFTLSFGTATAEAGEDDIASGQCGTCDWVIDADGVLTISGGELETWYNSPPWRAYADQVTDVKTTGPVVVATAAAMFADLNVPVLDLSSFDTSNVTNMKNMFAYAKADVIDFSSLDTSKVLNMEGMFWHGRMPELDLTGLVIPDNADLTDMLKNIPSQDIYQQDHYVLIYFKSSSTIFSKSVISLRPLVCHKPVNPGLMANRAL